MPVYSATLATGATGDGVTVPVLGTNGWANSNQAPPVGTVYDTLVAVDTKRAVTTSCSGPTCAPLGPHILLYSPDKSLIVLDGAPGIDFFSLPAGFLIQTLNVRVILAQFFVSDGAKGEVFHDGSLKATYTLAGFGAPPRWPTNGQTLVTVPNPTLYSAFYGQCKVIVTSTILNSLSVNADFAGIIGNYIIWSTQLTLTVADNIITIIDDANPLDDCIVDPNQLKCLTRFNFIDSAGTNLAATIISQTANQVKLNFPVGLIGNIAVIGASATIIGVFLGLAQKDFSGIYISSPSTKDQFYDRSTTPPTTIGVKIPNPTIRTGFISDEDEGYYR